MTILSEQLLEQQDCIQVVIHGQKFEADSQSVVMLKSLDKLRNSIATHIVCNWP